MATQRAINILQQHGQLDWSVLLVGWRRGWATRADIIAFAVAWLIQHPDDENSCIVDLAGGESLKNAELEALLENHVAAVNGSLPDDRRSPEVDKWRLAHLKLIADGAIDPETKLVRLEELYAEFDYPEDMAACSRYHLSPSQRQHGWVVGDHAPSPLDAMEAVIRELEERL